MHGQTEVKNRTEQKVKALQSITDEELQRKQEARKREAQFKPTTASPAAETAAAFLARSGSTFVHLGVHWVVHQGVKRPPLFLSFPVQQQEQLRTA